jgi:tetratricopeptide (TPR) repeat protein
MDKKTDETASPEPDCFEFLILDAVALHRDGKLDDAKSRYLEILETHPDHAGVLHNLGVAAAQGGDPAAALGWFDRALDARPDYAQAHLNRGGALHELGRLEEASDAYGAFLAAEPDHYDAILRLARVEIALGRRDRALACLARTNELRRAASAVTSVSKLKLDHDIAQFRFLSAAHEDADRFARLAADFSGLHLTAAQSGRIDESFARPAHQACPPAVAGSALEPSLDPDAITEAFRSRAPGYAVVDHLLAPEALAALRQHLLGSTIWHDFAHIRGFLAAYLEDGLASPLLLQIGADLVSTFPEIFRDHALHQAWAFKCVGGHQSVDVHLDAAAVSVNFWITPDAANRDPDHGGLVLYNAPPPPEWRIAGYDRDIAAIREFLSKSGASRTVIPHRANRAVIFESDQFHESDTVDFEPGYENHRINITLLFGQREG